jgi:HAD superfamily hydrolase (TIGR01490 family)
MSQRLALFDLDNTLLEGDSDHAWGEFLINRGLVDEGKHRAVNDQFYKDYLNENLDMHAYVAFSLDPILSYTIEQRDSLLADFMKQSIENMILKRAQTLVDTHKSKGDFCAIITATSNIITIPIAEAFRIEHLIATEAEVKKNYLTGKIVGVPCYKRGKIEKLKQWLINQPNDLSLEDSIFYSDSINDLPLLEAANEAVAVDPDHKLLQLSRKRNWKIISLRD